MQVPARRRGAATLGSSLALLGAAALTPGALAAGQVHSCANKVITTEVPGPQGPIKHKMTIKAISTKGVTCAAAYKFLELAFKNTTSVTPEHYACKTGHFKVPRGYVPQVCTRPGARIQYAAQGG
jgi:hypothetical protein